MWDNTNASGLPLYEVNIFLVIFISFHISGKDFFDLSSTVFSKMEQRIIRFGGNCFYSELE